MYTDTLREEVKEVNHHGKPRKVEADDDGMAPVEDVVKVSPADLKHRREDNEVAARTKNLEVRLTDELPASKDKMYDKGELLGTYPGQGTKGQIIKIEGPAKTGRYVLVQMNNQDCLNLHEVEAFGIAGSPGNGKTF